jgi:hypothetical protein
LRKRKQSRENECEPPERNEVRKKNIILLFSLPLSLPEKHWERPDEQQLGRAERRTPFYEEG